MDVKIFNNEIDMHPCLICGTPTTCSWCGKCDIIAAMGLDNLDEGVSILNAEWDDETFQSVHEAIVPDPKEWWLGAHFHWGMGVRNLLRDNGFRDDRSPSGNLDDVYIQVIEEAVRRWNT